MFSATVDLYDVPPAWWEADCVKYGLSHVPVRSRLTSLMGTNVVRLTDRRYMIQLASRLQKDYEAHQKARIERRKLKAVSIVPQLRELLPRSLLKTTRRRHECEPKFHAYAAKMCKQLPQMLLANYSEPRVKF
ncbi:PREDICTED: uncharacterized protein LOC108778157 [Cyphomyrmex costatus]|uniref:uncharacterized protein LOC108778157 n=1 Tax=Cyphomyrmex costatus TaxID=456900 RepID=UPI00085237A7|nr:PREDICTED: uncharacterized protein LOC108778157 [Cyphomyrmex costatus]